MVSFLSFDCAHKSLAVTHLSIHRDKISEALDAALLLSGNMATSLQNPQITKPTKNNQIATELDRIIAIVKSVIVIHSIDVYDTMPDVKISGKNKSKEATPEVMAKAIRMQLDHITDRIQGSAPRGFSHKIIDVDHILIEWQMSLNDKSRAVSNQILSYFAYNKVLLVGPSGKNSITFSEEGKYQNFIQKYSSTYAANKNHAKYNFLFFLNTLDATGKISHINKMYYDDIADATMQIFGALHIIA